MEGDGETFKASPSPSCLPPPSCGDVARIRPIPGGVLRDGLCPVVTLEGRKRLTVFFEVEARLCRPAGCTGEAPGSCIRAWGWSFPGASATKDAAEVNGMRMKAVRTVSFRTGRRGRAGTRCVQGGNNAYEIFAAARRVWAHAGNCPARGRRGSTPSCGW